MILREKVGQFFMLGFAGTSVSRDLADLLARYRPGGIILFSRNLETPAQIVRLTNDLQKLSPQTPLLISVDQEGGRVSRLPDGFTLFPPSSVFGQCDSSGDRKSTRLNSSHVAISYAVFCLKKKKKQKKNTLIQTNTILQ